MGFQFLTNCVVRGRGKEGGVRIKLSFRDHTEFRADAGETTMFHLAVGAQD